MAQPLSMRDLYRTPVLSHRGRRVGRAIDVLVHPKENRVIGYVVERPRLLFLLDRKDRYLAADRSRATLDAIEATDDPAAWDAKASARTGVAWDDTVIWSGMPVRTVGRLRLGAVRDVTFVPESGEIVSIQLSGGAAADVALGLRSVEAGKIVGYRDGAVVVSDVVAQTETSGGVAAAAGRGAVVARKQVTEAGSAAGRAAKSAIEYGGAAARAAAGSPTGKKTISWLKSVRDELADAMGDPDDDD